MGRGGGARKADRTRPGASAPRGPLLATLAVLGVFVLVIGGLALAAAHHHGRVSDDSQPAGYNSLLAVPSPTASGVRTLAPPPSSTTSSRLRRSETSRLRAEARRLRIVQGRHLKRAKRAAVIKQTTFRVASFNLLGASHTAGSAGRKGYGSAASRLSGEFQMLVNKQITVAGLQEFQPPQVDAFHRLAGDAWGVFPGPSVDNSIVWLRSQWTEVEAETRPFPYFHARVVQDPIVLLKNVETGREVWFVNIHSPADVHGMHNAGLRAATVAREASLVQELNQDGTPVILTGDMNDRALFACSFTRQSGMHSSDGWRTQGGACLKGTGYPNVDWIMGSDSVSFADGVPDFTSEHRHLSDHPIITATATIPAGAATP